MSLSAIDSQLRPLGFVYEGNVCGKETFRKGQLRFERSKNGTWWLVFHGFIWSSGETRGRKGFELLCQTLMQLWEERPSGSRDFDDPLLPRLMDALTVDQPEELPQRAYELVEELQDTKEMLRIVQHDRDALRPFLRRPLFAKIARRIQKAIRGV